MACQGTAMEDIHAGLQIKAPCGKLVVLLKSHCLAKPP